MNFSGNLEIKNIILSIAAIMIIIFTAYFPSLKNDFSSLDDEGLVTKNELITEISKKNLYSIFFTSYEGLYHPFVLMSYMIEYHFWGLNPKVFHAANLMIHIANSLLVYLLIMILCKNNSAALITAVLFGIHPLHVESVAWISERKDVLYSFFFFLSMIFYAVREKRQLYYWLSLITFFASLMSKAMAVSLPVLLILIDYFFTKKIILKNKINFFVLSIFFGVIALLTHYNAGAVSHAPAINISANFINAGNGLLFYFKKLIYPSNLSSIYPNPEGILGLLFVLFAVIAVIHKRKDKTIVFGSLFFLTAIGPAIQFIPIGQKVPADRYSYIASIGLFYIISEKLSSLSNKNVKKILLIILSICIILLSYMTWKRCLVWKNGISLFDDVINKYPGMPNGYKNRGDAFKQSGENEKALLDYTLAIELKTDYFEALNNRGTLYSDQGRFNEAVKDFSAALKYNPNYLTARYNRAVAYARIGENFKAVEDYSRVIAADPSHLQSYNNRGVLYGKIGEFEKAVKDFDKAVSLKADFKEACINRQTAYNLYKNKLLDNKKIK